MDKTMYYRAATFEPSTWDEGKRTIECTFASEIDVLRRDWDGDFVERLDVTAEAMDLTRLRNSGQLLDNHKRTSVDDILGRVLSAELRGGKGVATVFLGERPKVAAMLPDILNGVIGQVSAGYTVSRWANSKRSDGMRVITAKAWEPWEVSLVPLGADPTARTRSFEESLEERGHMDLQQQLRNMANAFRVPDAFADDLATRAVTLEAGRDAISAEAQRLFPAINPRSQAVITRDSRADLRTRMADGLRSRMNPAHTVSDGGREFAYSRISDLARRCLTESGQSDFGAGPHMLQRALTTSDLPIVLMEVFNKELLVLKTAPSPILQIFKKGTPLVDYRRRHILEFSAGVKLQPVNESGEVKHGTVNDKELASYQPKPYATILDLTIQVLQNDDMGVLSDLSGQLVMGARQWFNGFLVDVIISNPKLADGKAIFHTDHGNIAATPGAPPSDVTIQAGKLAMRKQVNLGGDAINATPRFIFAPAELEGSIDKLLASLYPAQPDQAAVSARTLTPLIDANLDAKGQAAAWYLFASPAEAPVFEYSELQGAEGPAVVTREGFEVLGTQFRVEWHFGASAIDSRGGFKNPGA